MKLCVYTLNDISILDLPYYTPVDLGENNPFIKIEDEDLIPSNYSDISSIETWYNFYSNVNIDYKKAREEIRKLVDVLEWENLSNTEKDISVRLFIVGSECRNELYTLTEQVQLGATHHENSIRSRFIRLSAIQLFLFNTLEKHDWQEVGLELTQTGLLDRYVNQGIEGTLEGDIEGFFDYVLSREGTSFENSGFLNKTYTPIGMTLQQIADKAIDILKNGNY